MGWIKAKYFRTIDGREWTFFAKDTTGKDQNAIISLINISQIPILRHVKVKGSASPFDPDLIQYWNARFERQHRKLANPSSLDYAVRVMLRA
jgi:RNA-directed DNA polymerase